MQKLYYSISEISGLVDEEQHILRYWEKEFAELAPRKNRAGNRVYSEKDFVVIKIIKKLLREEKLPLKSAKEKLKSLIEKGAEADYLASFFHKNDDTTKSFPVSNVNNEITNSNEEIISVLKDVLNYLKAI